jgi:ribosomal protein L7/L12
LTLSKRWKTNSAFLLQLLLPLWPPHQRQGQVLPQWKKKTEFTVMLTGFGDKKVQVIKVIRAITGLGLKEAKDLVEGVPSVVKEAIPKADAEKIKKELEENGGTVEIK